MACCKWYLSAVFILCFNFQIIAYLIYNHACELYGWVQNFCTPKTCPVMTAGMKYELCFLKRFLKTISFRYEFKWADGKTVKFPVSISAIEYINHLFAWIEFQLNDRQIFPNYDSAHYSQTIFMPTIKDIFRRMVRVYAHVLHHHLKNLENIGYEKSFLDGVRYFVHFFQHNDLVDEKSLGPITYYPDWMLLNSEKRSGETS